MKQYLIDTQIAIWTKGNARILKPEIKAILEDTDNEIYVSHFSFQEIAIKLQVGKLPEFIVSVEEFAQKLADDDFISLPITINHIISYKDIPFYEDHRDPFDRMILATALSENLIVITSDDKFDRYSPLIEIIKA